MARNRKYRNVYTIRVVSEGTCTNGFTAKVKDSTVKGIVEALRYNIGETTLTVEETKGDFNAETGEITEE